MAAIKRTPADIAFSLCIREAYDWTCNRCKTKYPERAGGLECSHHHSRGKWGVRFEPLNAEALCTGCHFLTGGTEERRNEVLTREEQDLLYEMINDTDRGREARKTKGKGEIAKHFREEFKRLKAERESGRSGKLEVVGYL